MFRKIMRKKNELPQEDAKKLLHICKRGALCLNGDGGYPYAIPVNFYYDEDENRIYIHSSKKGHKIDSIRANDKVCFTVWRQEAKDKDGWSYHFSSCVVFGCAKLIEDRDLTEEKVRIFAMKYYPSAEEVEEEIQKDIHAVQLIAIDIEHISGKRVHEK